jgi:hypothetical protein
MRDLKPRPSGGDVNSNASALDQNSVSVVLLFSLVLPSSSVELFSRHHAAAAADNEKDEEDDEFDVVGGQSEPLGSCFPSVEAPPCFFVLPPGDYSVPQTLDGVSPRK